MEIPPLFRIIRWFGLCAVYFWIIGACASITLLPLNLALNSSSDNYNVQQSISGIFGFLGCLIPIIIFGGIMALMAWIFKMDKARERTASDDFKNENLLYRYGYKINEITLPIAVKTEWTDNETQEFVNAMRQRIASQIQNRFAGSGVQVTSRVHIKDKDLPSDNRTFLKVIFRSIRGSQASHFITYAVAGKYVVIHYISLIRGKYRWHDAVDFVISSPLTIWFWGLSWVQNQYSIIASISKIVGNSYDLLDLKTYFEASYLVLLDETRNFIKEKGLLTDELNQIIVNNINNSQNISISGSSGVKLGDVVNAVQSAIPGLGKQI